MKKYILLAVILPTLAIADQTQLDCTPIHYSNEYNTCMDKSGGVTANMLDCTGAENDKKDKELNQIYHQIMKEADLTHKKQTREAQRAWLKFRDANCAEDPESGTIAEVNSADCYLDMTTHRIEELKQLRDYYAQYNNN
jgi:uncharacterized protein YecT (DUF1311 family)